jgi:transposase-like protein
MEPTTLQEAILYFANPVNCREYLVARRWPIGVSCPRCGSQNVLFMEKYNRWHCREKHDAPQFTLKTGTAMEDSPIGLDKWLMAMWMVVNCKNGVSSYEIHRSLGVTQKTAWFLDHRIRLMLGAPVAEKLGGKGGEPKNWHLSKRASRKRFSEDKPRSEKVAVVGMLDRDARQVRAKVVPNVKRETLQDAILENIEGKSTVYTDGYKGYDQLKAMDFIHETVNHMEEYVRGNVHTNGIENFWALLKRGLKGTYVAAEPFHLDRYVTEQVFRYNNRKMTDADRFDLAVKGMVGKRLTYAEVTGKVLETQF